HGDRMYADDGAIIGGLGRIDERALMIIGHQKGRDTKERVRRNYGMPKPEGYRKALRLMRLAERFGLPLLTLIDTQGAYPGVGAEERGQSEAIARNLFEMSVLRIPIVTVVTGGEAQGRASGSEGEGREPQGGHRPLSARARGDHGRAVARCARRQDRLFRRSCRNPGLMP